MKLIVCGPAHSGKSVLIQKLERCLPADSYKTIRVNKDGEGDWSNNQNQEEIQKIRIKQDYDHNFIHKKCMEIKRASQQLVLVDIGGMLLDDKIPVFKACDSFLILSRERVMIQKWKEFGRKHGSVCIGEIFSDYAGNDELYEKEEYFKAQLSKLERGDKTISGVIEILAAYLMKKINYKPEEIDESVYINMMKVAHRLGREQTGENDYGKFIKDIRFDFSDAPDIYSTVREENHSLDIARLYASRANWVSAVAVKSLKDAGVKTVELFDTGFDRNIKIKNLQKTNNNKNPVIEFSVIESENEIFINMFCKKDEITLNDYRLLKIPYISSDKTLYLSGKMPNWLMCSVLSSYKNKNKYLLQPGNGFCCVDNPDIRKLGIIVKDTEEIDTHSFLAKFQLEKSQKIIYFDMDRVLVDFASQAEKYRILKKNERINWLKVFFLGHSFWKDMEWMPGAEKAYKEIRDFAESNVIKTAVLSSVKLVSGRKGKTEWCRNNLNLTDDDIVLVRKSADKRLKAGSKKILIDDNEKNVGDFVKAGGKAFCIRKWDHESVQKIKELINSIK